MREEIEKLNIELLPFFVLREAVATFPHTHTHEK